MRVYVHRRRAGPKVWAVTGIIGFAAAAGVTQAGGGIDDPNSDRRCIAHERELGGCNPDVGKLFGRCVIMAGTGQPGVMWLPSTCTVPHAVPANVARAGDDQPRPALAGCGLTDTAAILATIRTLESGGRYSAVAPVENPDDAASGAYQFVRGTWAGYGGYRRAVDAPPAVQDAKATEHAQHWLNVGGVEAVPVGWYLGHIPQGAEWDTVPAAWAGNSATPRQYQRAWMATYARVTSGCDS